MILTKANICVEQNCFNEALHYYKQLPKSSRVYFNVAILYIKRTKYQRAITMLHKSLEIDAYNCLSHFLLGCCFFQVDLVVQATSHMSKCVQMMNNNDFVNYKPLGLDYVLTMETVQKAQLPSHLKLYYPRTSSMMTPPASPLE